MLATAKQRTAFGELSFLQSSGTDGKPAVLLLHSLGTSKRMYAKVIAHLAEFHCVACDILGHGDSDKAPVNFTIPDHASAVIEFIDALGLRARSLIIAGCSLGALIALELVARAPAVANGLMLNGVPGGHLESQRLGRFRTLTSKLLDSDGRLKDSAEVGGGAFPIEAAERAARRRDLEKSGPNLLSAAWSIAAFDLAIRLPKIVIPTAILMGDKDFHVPTSYTLQEDIKGATLEFVENAGHLTPYDDPAAVASAIRRLHISASTEDSRALGRSMGSPRSS
jgi:pimeloyl-ACP methyl ester carboxylesterase